jgi:hypothetical protein
MTMRMLGVLAIIGRGPFPALSTAPPAPAPMLFLYAANFGSLRREEVCALPFDATRHLERSGAIQDLGTAAVALDRHGAARLARAMKVAPAGAAFNQIDFAQWDQMNSPTRVKRLTPRAFVQVVGLEIGRALARLRWTGPS